MNTASGYNALKSCTTGQQNTMIGYQAGHAITTSGMNVSVGHNSLHSNTTGIGNTCLGREAGHYITGGGNVVIGGASSASGNYTPAYNITSQSNFISMGNSGITNAYIKVGWSTTSDERDKTNFAEVPYGLSFVKQLQPYSFEFRVNRESEETDGGVRYGFKAQDILALEGESPVIIDNSDEDKLFYKESNMTAVLVKAVQELTAKVEALEAQLNA